MKDHLGMAWGGKRIFGGEGVVKVQGEFSIRFSDKV